MDARPQVDDVASVAALRGEALEDVVGQMHAERAAARVAAVDRTRAAALRAVAARAGPGTRPASRPGNPGPFACQPRAGRPPGLHPTAQRLAVAIAASPPPSATTPPRRPPP